jgi:hypothetical protein
VIRRPFDLPADAGRELIVDRLLCWAGHPSSARDLIAAIYRKLPTVPPTEQARVIDACVRLGWQTAEGADRLRTELGH